MEIAEKVCVVTGAGSGIGAAIARAAAAEGAREVVVADLDGEAAAEVADQIAGTAAQVDVTDSAALQALVKGTEAVHGPIGLFVSNAGYVTNAGLEDTDERIQHMWEVHVLAHIVAARAVVPQMIANGGGYLLNTASAAGLLTQVGSLSYSITKAAAVSLAEWLAITHHHQGIRVSVLCPQAVRTNILVNSPDQAASTDGDRDWSGAAASFDGVIEPDEVARLCVEAMREERFLVLPHEEVHEYRRRKADDPDRWLAGMRKFQDLVYPEGPLPGDVMAPDV
ncbi:MAG: SDR family oxidoreductase [Acidimicrobiales bacterium]